MVQGVIFFVMPTFNMKCKILVQHMDKFKDQKRLVTWRIPCTFAAEMSSVSKVVSRVMQVYFYLITILI